jgi:hypothetical protein
MKTEKMHGKMSSHFQGLGTVTREMVQARARELALINGRAPEAFTQEDWQQARRELTGQESALEDTDPVAAATRWSEAPGTTGHRVDKESAPDEETIAEELVREGVEEAEHEQMVEGAKYERNQE